MVEEDEGEGTGEGAGSREQVPGTGEKREEIRVRDKARI